MRGSGAPVSSAMYSVWPREGLAGESHRFFVERTGDHGVGLAVHAQLNSAPDVSDGGKTVLGAELAKFDFVIGGERAGLDQRAGQRAGVNSADALSGVENGRIGDEQPFRQRGDRFDPEEP